MSPECTRGGKKKLYVGKLWFVPALNARRAQERLGI
jgi:hypothetical protein